jgi:SAM-dependent methyltransferase
MTPADSPGADRRRLFGLDPPDYDRARPPYPERVYDVLRSRCGLRPGVRTLEIGPGTGLATRRLLDLGASPLVAIEPDARLAEFVVAHVPRAGRILDVRVAGFEEAALEPASFDLAVSATAFHWLDQRPALEKVGRVLRSGGWLALWWNVFGDPARHDAFHEATQDLLRPLAGPTANVAGRPPFPLDVEARLADLEAAAVFTDLEHELVRWPSRMDPGQIRALYATFPTISQQAEPERERILDALARITEEEFGGIVERPFATAIYTARRR